jgi:hypothetical protein
MHMRRGVELILRVHHSYITGSATGQHALLRVRAAIILALTSGLLQFENNICTACLLSVRTYEQQYPVVGTTPSYTAAIIDCVIA